MSEVDDELLLDLKTSYETGYKETYPQAAISTYEQERRLAADCIERLKNEIRYLRRYGNKDCIALADAARAKNELDI